MLGRPLWSERLARWQFVALVTAIVGMVAHFALAEWVGLAWAAANVAAALVTHIADILMTVRGLTRWTFTARLVVVGHVGLAATALSGAVLAIDKASPFVPGTMTLTTPGCPRHEVMTRAAGEPCDRCLVSITLTFDPPWTPDRLQAR